MDQRLFDSGDVTSARLIRRAMENCTLPFARQALDLLRAEAAAAGTANLLTTIEGVHLLGTVAVHILRRTMQIRSRLALETAPASPGTEATCALAAELAGLPDSDSIIGAEINANGRFGSRAFTVYVHMQSECVVGVLPSSPWVTPNTDE